MARTQKKKTDNGGSNLGFEAKLWAVADKLQGRYDTLDYKHDAQGLIIL